MREIIGLGYYAQLIALAGPIFLFACSSGADSASSGGNAGTSAGCSVTLLGGATNCALSLSSTVTTIAGPAAGASTSGDADGVQNSARFSMPYHMAVSGGFLYLADLSNHKIRRLTIANNTVTTIAGPAAGTVTTGDTDGVGNAARFNQIRGITTDGTHIYIADGGNNKIRRYRISDGDVSTIAGPAQGSTTSGDTDATGNLARFNGPFAITMDTANLYIVDRSNNKIRKMVISTGAVSTLAGPAAGTTTSGDSDGTGNAARFNAPNAITTDGTHLYVADMLNHKIRKIEISNGAVTTLAGPAAGSVASGDADGTGTTARFNAPNGITTDGTYLYVTDGGSHKIRRISIATQAVTTIAGPSPGSSGSGDDNGQGSAAKFNWPIGITTDGQSLFVSEGTNNKIRKIQ
ncbi:MAG: hypothetical protein ACOY5B_12800 [Spirochaetota bacterium]